MKDQKKIKPKKKFGDVQFIWGMLCSISSIDQEKNNISLFSVLEQFNLPEQFFIESNKQRDTPVLFPIPYEIVLSLRRTLSIQISGEEIPLDLKIKNIDSSGKSIQELLFQISFPKDLKRLRIRIPVPGVIVTNPGDYSYQIEVKTSHDVDFRKVLEIPLEITMVK